MRKGWRQALLLVLVGYALVLALTVATNLPSFLEQQQQQQREPLQSRGGAEAEGVIPAKIWTFWHSDTLPDFFAQCVATWRACSPEYELVLLTPTNWHLYLPQERDREILYAPPFAQDVRLLSDIVRLRVLAVHGGIWMDTSVICSNRSLDAFRNPPGAPADLEFAGFFARRFTDARFLPRAPMVESWMFACPPRSSIVRAWMREFEKLRDYGSDIAGFVARLRVDTQNLAPDAINYLVVYLCLQKVLQRDPDCYRRMHLVDSDTTAMSYLHHNGWKTQPAVDDLLRRAAAYRGAHDVLKICKEERAYLLTLPYHHLFDLSSAASASSSTTYPSPPPTLPRRSPASASPRTP